MKPISLSAEELSDLIGLVYESAFETPQWKSFLERMTKVFPGTGALVFGHEDEMIFPSYVQIGSVPRILSTSGFEVDFLNNDKRGALSATLRAPNGFVARSRKNADPDTYEQSNFYRRLMKPYGYKQFLTLKLDSHNNRGAFITFTVSSDAELEEAVHDPLFEVLKLLGPHAVRALQISRSLTLARNAINAMGGFLDTIILPLLVVTSSAEFVFANAAGRRLVAREEPICIAASGKVGLTNAHDTENLRRKLGDMERQPAASGMQVEQAEGALSLCITPFKPSSSGINPIDRDLLQEERLFAIFVGQQQHEAINPILLQDVFDLTLRESEVCRDVLAGHSPAQIAETSGRSLKTVRNQIQSVHEKVGVTSNTALMDALSIFRTVGAMFDDDDDDDDVGRTAVAVGSQP